MAANRVFSPRFRDVRLELTTSQPGGRARGFYFFCARVGVPGLEPGTSRSQSERSSQLNYTPTRAQKNNFQSSISTGPTSLTSSALVPGVSPGLDPGELTTPASSACPPKLQRRRRLRSCLLGGLPERRLLSRFASVNSLFTLVPSVRIELTTPASSGLRSTTELTRHQSELSFKTSNSWWAVEDLPGRAGSGFAGNLRPLQCQCNALTS